MKISDILGSATSNMARSKARTALTIIAVFIGSLTITLTLGISSGISSYIDKQLGSVGAENVLIIQAKIEMNLGGGPQKYDPEKKNTNAQSMDSMMLKNSDIEKIKTQEGLTNIQPVIMTSPDYISGSSGEKYQISVQSFVDGSTMDMASGKLIDNNSKESEVLIPKDYVSVLGYLSDEDAIGKIVTFGITSPLGEKETITATIIGVQQKSIITEGQATSNNVLSDKLSSIQTHGLPEDTANSYYGVTAQFKKGTTTEELQTIKDGIDKMGYTGQTVADQIGIVKQVIDAITYVLIFFGAIALLAASFGIVNTLFMSVQERTKEIGLMKAMGMSGGKIFMLFSVEAILLGFWGGLLGSLTAICVGQIANKIAAENFLKDLPGFMLTEFPPLSIIMIMGIVMFIAFLAGTLPARSAAKQDPIEALRYD
jgi:putative ABC transport system permease protein